MTSELFEIAQDLLQEFNNKEPRFKNRALSPIEKEYFGQIRDSSHYRTGLILRKQKTIRMAFMSLPFATLIKEMNEHGIDIDFMTYLSLEVELEVEDPRLKF
jgi:hypothetical protein